MTIQLYLASLIRGTCFGMLLLFIQRIVSGPDMHEVLGPMCVGMLIGLGWGIANLLERK